MGERSPPPRLNTLQLVRVEGLLPYASNATVLAQSRDGRLWVYKPERGESPLWDFPWPSLARREILAFEVAQAMELEVVPETRQAEGPLGPGSAQAFVTEDLSRDPRVLVSPNIDLRMWPVAVLDIVCNNADRKLGHLLMESGSDRIWAIDNGLTFHVEPKLRTVLWGFSGRPLPPELVGALERLATALEGGLLDRVTELLSFDEAQALNLRVHNLINEPVHPSPPEDRPAWPWPLL